MTPKWSSKFELKPGKWVFVPTTEAIAEGQQIKTKLETVWKPPSYFYHLRAGGHVAALRSHLHNTSFLHLDLQNFFGSINRSRITRCLKPKVSYPIARKWAVASTVPNPADKARYMLPYGFVQSQLIASLCLHESALGLCLLKLSQHAHAAVSVYVDDVLVSTKDNATCEGLFALLKTAVERAGFTLNVGKSEGPAPSVTAFNVKLSEQSIAIDGQRMKQFSESLAGALTEEKRAGIRSYIASVNLAQLDEL